MCKNNELETSLLAALLHDIGKFWQRTGVREEHARVGVHFINNFQEQYPYQWLDDLRDAIGDHHKSFTRPIEEIKRIVKIVKLADQLSSGERESDPELPGSDPDKTPLIPILSRIEFRTLMPEEKWATRLSKLSLDENSMPVPKKEADVNPEKYKNLWEEFIDEFKKIGTIDSISKITTLIFLLKKYTSSIPSATPWEEDEEYRTLPDIPLYDHLKSTCAIAACLLKLPDKQIEEMLLRRQSELEKPVCQIIRADISGIQPFIYRITEPTEGRKKGTAKRLRGRSLYLSILLDVIANWFIREFNLSIANILFCGGGRFDILLPIDHDTFKKFEELKKKVNDYLLKNFYGELGIQIASENIYPKDFNDLKHIYESLEDKLKYYKQRKFCESFSTQFFVSNEKLYDVCDVCNLTPKAKRETCETCKKHEDIGQKAPHTTAIAFVYNKVDYLNFDEVVILPFQDFETSVVFVPRKEEREIINKILSKCKKGIFYKLNSTEFLHEQLISIFGLGFKFLGNEAPIAKEQIKGKKGEEAIEEDEVLSFDRIADMSSGTRLLGVLKADVDYLGSLFHLGIEPKMTISRVSAVSSSIDFFFTGYLNRICENLAKIWHSDHKNQNPLKGKIDGLFYIVYSGGDDLFIIGPWDQTVDLAKELNSSFKAYTCKNPNLSIAAGILMVKPHFPIQRFSQLVGEQLKLSKSDADKRVGERIKPYEKNRLTLFRETVIWEDDHPNFARLLSFGKDLAKFVQEEKLPRTFVHFLLRLHKQYLENTKEEKPLWTPKFLYALIRRVKDEYAFMELLREVPIFVEKIRIPLWYASLITRKEV